MTREELIEFLRNNLTIEVNDVAGLSSTEVTVRLKLDGTTISEDSVSIET